MNNVIDIFTRAPLAHSCCRCSAPTATQGACSACIAEIESASADSEVRRARMWNAANRCPQCRCEISAHDLLAIVPSGGYVLCLPCGFGK